MILHSDEGDTTCSFVRLDSVGQGGAFLLCSRPVPIGTQVDLAICLAGGVIRTRARVLYHRRSDDDQDVGIGVEFLALSDDSAQLLDQLVAPASPEE